MYYYEAEFQYILQDYLALSERIEKWQKSIPPNPQMSDKGFKIAQQFRLTAIRPSFVFDKLDYIDKSMGGLKKFVSVIPIETKEESNNPKDAITPSGAAKRGRPRHDR